MKPNDQIVPSLTVVTAGYLAAQILVFRFIVDKHHSREYLEAFLLTTVIVHVVLYAALFVMRSDFVLIPAEIQLRHINVANLMTMFRISTTPTIIFLLLLSRHYRVMTALIVLTSLAFLTDLLDGQISRRLRQTTRIGRYLDSMSDYAMLMAVSFGLWIFQLLSKPFLLLVLARLFFYGLGMLGLLLYQGHVDPKATPWGKAAIFATMTIYATSLLQLVPGSESWSVVLVRILQWPAGAILIASFVEKTAVLYRDFAAAARRHKAHSQA